VLGAGSTGCRLSLAWGSWVLSLGAGSTTAWRVRSPCPALQMSDSRGYGPRSAATVRGSQGRSSATDTGASSAWWGLESAEQCAPHWQGSLSLRIPAHPRRTARGGNVAGARLEGGGHAPL